METQSKKDQWNKSKDRKKGFQLVCQAVCFVLRFLFIASCGIIFLLNSSA